MALDNVPSQIAHLLRRAGFGATEAELAQYVSLGFDGALDRLLNPELVDDSATDQLLTPLTTDLGDPKKIEAAKFWWFSRMLYTQRPLLEVIGEDRHVALRADGAGNWSDGIDSPLSHLNGAIDVDLSASPFTNTLAIRRLSLSGCCRGRARPVEERSSLRAAK